LALAFWILAFDGAGGRTWSRLEHIKMARTSRQKPMTRKGREMLMSELGRNGEFASLLARISCRHVAATTKQQHQQPTPTTFNQFIDASDELMVGQSTNI